MSDDKMQFKIEGARIIYRNFSGNETLFKPEGTRTFAVVLDKPTADVMAADGWNVKCKVRGEDDDPEEFCFIEVAVGYKIRPPKIVVITETSRTNLTEQTVGTLDWADVKNIDLIVNGSHWDVGGKTGVKAYLKTMFVEIEEDDLERKYAIREDMEHQ